MFHDNNNIPEITMTYNIIIEIQQLIIIDYKRDSKFRYFAKNSIRIIYLFSIVILNKISMFRFLMKF